ncbi:hypothetical protein [Candidatus Nesciobacter abundans]|uniref:Chromosomal replication initiator protein DnaA domain-containing protein n=1 Tax=Candidatus Nesciobacter abundans TaxID=2601668 RepID=A0A5C0UHV3_9PROT|nr:hypothetical protein [Candidatus Nesciobacter abundans]QEK39310.1 hypothetical protein FZC36_02665 [Candidatus Nesciobacter abundans]
MILELKWVEKYSYNNFSFNDSNSSVCKWINSEKIYNQTLLIGPRKSGKRHISFVWLAKLFQNYKDKSIFNHIECDENSSYKKHFDINSFDVELYECMFSDNKTLHLFNNACSTTYEKWDRISPLIIRNNNIYKEEEMFEIFFHANANAIPVLWVFENPEVINEFIPDLSSRLKSINLVSIDTPDLDILKTVMIKRFSDYSLNVSNEFCRFALYRICKSYESVNEFVLKVHELCLQKHRAPTIPFLVENNVLGYDLK